MDTTASVERTLTVAASFGLPSAQATSAALDTAREVDAVLAAVADARVHGLFAAAVAAGAIHGPGLTEDATRIHHAMLATSLLAEEAAVLVHDALTSIGIEFRALKGLASAHLDYPEPGWRVFGDVDVLVRARDLRRALSALASAGFERRRPPVRGWWERRYGRSVTMRALNGSELDLHLRIAGGYFGARLDHDALWSRPSSSFDLAGRTFLALSPEDRFLHACCHAVLGDRSGLRAYRDVAQLALVSGADWRVAMQHATHAGVASVVGAAVGRAWRDLALEDDDVVRAARGCTSSATDVDHLDAYERTFASDWGPEGRTTLSALGPLDRTLFLLGLAFPSSASLRDRGRTRLGHLRARARVLRSRR